METGLMALLTIAISLIKLGQGFDFDIKTIMTPRNRPIIFKGVIVGVFLVPVLFILIILLLKPSIPMAGALIVMALCPSADLSIQQVEKLGGDIPLAAGVQVISALISIATIPLFLKLFEVIFGAHYEIKFSHLIREIAVAQFIPMIVGVTLRKFFPNYAWLAKFIMRGATILLALCFIAIFIQNYKAFVEFKIEAYLTIIFATVCAFILGVVAAWKNIKRQISLAIETSLRNPGLAYLIASENFLLERVNKAMVPYVLTLIITVVICTILLKQSHKLFNKWSSHGKSSI